MVTDEHGVTANASPRNITVSNDLIADFTPNQKFSTGRPHEIEFYDNSTGSPDSWFWQFGDGYVEVTQNVTHSYVRSGTYPVSLTVRSDHLRKTDTKHDLVTVI
jgi:PKD repeat protein